MPYTTRVQALILMYIICDYQYKSVKRKRIQLAYWCYFCNEMEETIDHLMLHCCWSQNPWVFYFAVQGEHYTMDGSVKNTLRA